MSDASPAAATKVSTRELLNQIPWDEVADLLEDLDEAGLDEDDAIRVAAAVLDAALPFDLLLPGVVGNALEAVDRKVLEAALRFAWRNLDAGKTPEERAQRKAARQSRRQQRQTERKARRKARREGEQPRMVVGG